MKPENLIERAWEVSPDSVYGLLVVLLIIMIVMLYRQNNHYRKNLFSLTGQCVEAITEMKTVIVSLREEIKDIRTHVFNSKHN